MMVFVRTLTGKTMTLELEPHHTLIDIKEKVFEREHYPLYSQRFMHNGQLIPYGKTLQELGIEKETCITQVTRMRAEGPTEFGFRKQNGDQFNITLLAKELVSDVKQQIAQREGGQAEKITLRSGDRVLANTNHIGDYLAPWIDIIIEL